MDPTGENITSRIPSPRREVEEMNPYQAPLEGRRKLLRLDFNENTIGPSPLVVEALRNCLLYTSPSPRDGLLSRMPSSA